MSKLKLAVLGVLVLGGSLSPSVTWAQKAKYTRQQDLKVDVKLSDRVKPIVPKTAGEIKEQQPELSADQVLSIEGLVGDIRAEQEEILADLIIKTPDTEVDEKSDYYFRLGELYAKQQRYWRLKGTELQIQSDTSKNPQQKTKLKSDSSQAQAKAKDYLLKAVKTYKGLTDNDAFRNYPKMDMALFYYGYTLQSGKYMKEARSVYDKLLKNYPSSSYVPEAHLAFGDYFFEQGQLVDAEARYRVVLKFPKSRVYWYAMYKLGWIHFNLSRYQEALETFFQVAQATKADANQAALRHEALRDFVRAYAEIGKPDKASAAFGRVDRAAVADMLDFLVELYEQRGHHDAAATIRGIWEVPLPTDVRLAAPPTKATVAEDIPTGEQELIATLEAHAARAGAAERARLELEKAVVYRRHHHDDEAIAIVSDIVEHDPGADVAELAANLWLDSLVQLHRFDRALELADAFAADRRFLAGKTQLVRNIEFLRSHSLR